MEEEAAEAVAAVELLEKLLKAMLQEGRSQTVEAVPMEQAETVSEYRRGQLQLLLRILLG